MTRAVKNTKTIGAKEKLAKNIPRYDKTLNQTIAKFSHCEIQF